MWLKDIFSVSKIKSENEQLKNIFDEIGATEIVDVNAKIQELKKQEQSIETTVNKLQSNATALDNEIKNKKEQLIFIDEELSYESFALYTPHFEFTNSSEYKERLTSIRAQQKAMMKNDTAATGNQNWTVNNSKAQGKKMVNDMIKLVLRSFNNECDYCVDNVKFNNLENHSKRILKSFDTLNKLGKIMQVSISDTYKQLKDQELYLAYEYQQKKQEEKEEQKRIRAEVREQAKLEQEIKQAREKIMKERKHFNQAIDELNRKINITTDTAELQALNDKKAELENNITELNKEENLVDYREKNAKAGYVYIISNVGAFGESIYKIGMTRRLEPMDRVDELGDASVPFSFDVHALIFSDNAPELESQLHNHFDNGRINKINNRKEFFRADIKEIEKVIKENYNKVFDMIEIAPAEQYRQSLKIIS